MGEKSKSKRKVYLPTPETIERMRKEIQNGWTDKERSKRLVYNPDTSVVLEPTNVLESPEYIGPSQEVD